jgi:hypothetical protein
MPFALLPTQSFHILRRTNPLGFPNYMYLVNSSSKYLLVDSINAMAYEYLILNLYLILKQGLFLPSFFVRHPKSWRLRQETDCLPAKLFTPWIGKNSNLACLAKQSIWAFTSVTLESKQLAYRPITESNTRMHWEFGTDKKNAAYVSIHLLD